MQPDQLRPLQITEDDLEQARPAVRAMLIARLEQMWQPVALRLAQEHEGLPVDPRMLEIGLRIVKEEAGLYRLNRPPVSVPEEEEEFSVGVDRRQLVEQRLMEIEERLTASTSPDAGV